MSFESMQHERYPSLGTALRRHIAVALLVLVACTAAGVYWGYSKPIEYVAQAQLVAGATGVTVSATPAQAAASESLAETYSRVFAGDSVQTALRTAVPDLPRVSASPIPDSGIILIEVQADTPELAVQTANAGVDALEATVAGLLSNQAAVETATANLNEATGRLANAQRALAAAEAAQKALASPEADPTVSGAVASASAAKMTAEAEVQAARERYVKVIGETNPGNGVRRLASGEVTSDTSARRLQLGYAVGIVTGCVLGAGVAYGLALIGAQRAARRPLHDRP